MVRKSLITATLLAVASPAAAQQQEEWTPHRPDGRAPIGVTSGRVLEPGEMEVTYRLVHNYMKGVWFADDSIGLTQALIDYPVAPIDLTNQTHNLSIGYGVNERLSVIANIPFSLRERQQIARSASTATVTTLHALGDLELTGLYAFVKEGLYVAHAQLGAMIPTGSSDPAGDLSYDMRPGAGSFGVSPGLTVQTQNERGSVGAQGKARLYIGENSSGYRLGNQYEGSAWIALRWNDYFSLSARFRWESWSRIRGGGDPELVARQAEDPGNRASNYAGSRSDVLLGVNFSIPEGAHLGGNRLSIELLSPANRSYQGDQLGLVSGLVVGWQTSF